MSDNFQNPNKSQQCLICEELLKNMENFLSLIENVRTKPDTWLTVDEVANKLKVSKSIIYRLVRNGELKAINLAENNSKPSQKGHYRIKQQDLNNFINTKTVAKLEKANKAKTRYQHLPKVKNHLGL